MGDEQRGRKGRSMKNERKQQYSNFCFIFWVSEDRFKPAECLDENEFVQDNYPAKCPTNGTAVQGG